MIGLGGAEMALVLMFVLICVPICLALFAFWLWMLVCAIQNPGLTEGEKIAWVLVIVFLHALGALLYLLIGHPKRLTPLPMTPRT